MKVKLAFSAAVVALAGCGTIAQPLTAGSPSAPQIDSSAKSGPLLYISDAEPGAGTVYVFSYPKLRLVETLTGLGQPLGECVDPAGDVWITDYSGERLVEYAHGATAPRATLKDPNRRPYSCAVDPKSGDLAVANIFGPGDGPGGLSIYTRAHGRPRFYLARSLYESFFDAYDANGNVYVDGLTQLYNGTFALARLSGKKFTALHLNHAIGYPGGLAVTGSELNVGDQTYGANVVYQFTFKASRGTMAGSTPLSGAQDIRQFAISKASLVAGDGAYQHASGMVFAYPAGGPPTRVFGTGTFVAPFGAALSP